MYMAINDVIMYLMKLSAKWMVITEQGRENSWGGRTGKIEEQQDAWWGMDQIKQWIRIKMCKIRDREEERDNFNNKMYMKRRVYSKTDSGELSRGKEREAQKALPKMKVQDTEKRKLEPQVIFFIVCSPKLIISKVCEPQLNL